MSCIDCNRISLTKMRLQNFRASACSHAGAVVKKLLTWAKHPEDVHLVSLSLFLVYCINLIRLPITGGPSIKNAKN